MKKYKYKIGQIVKWNSTKYISTNCDCCGKDNTEIKEIKASGKIIRRWQEPIWNILNGFVSDGVELIKGGTLDYRPPKSFTGQLCAVPVYEIKTKEGKTIIEGEKLTK